MSAGNHYGEEEIQSHMTKKCPYCNTYLQLRATKCNVCKKRVGNVDKLGFAAKPFDWSGYLVAIFFILALCVFIWWGFFRE
jgi:hypothetical protein